MEKVAIVLLNYLNYIDTIECIDSIKNDIYPNKYIIVVDNNSSNESWKILSNKYANKENIKLIKNEANQGFAKGNNVGINYARDILKCEFVLLANNDTIFQDKMMLTKLINSYDEGVGIIGPNIITKGNQKQNPMYTEFRKVDIENHIKHIEGSNIVRILRNEKNKFIRKLKSLGCIQNKKDDDFRKVQQVSDKLILHGACMMLTKDYFKYYKNLFPKTFLYYEEFILTLITEKVGLKKKYIPSAYIYHKDDCSSTLSFKNKESVKEKFAYESAKITLELMDLSYEEIIKKFE